MGVFKVWESLPESKDADECKGVCIEEDSVICGGIELGK